MRERRGEASNRPLRSARLFRPGVGETSDGYRARVLPAVSRVVVSRQLSRTHRLNYPTASVAKLLLARSLCWRAGGSLVASGLNRRTNGGRVKREKGRLRWLTVYSHRPLTPRAYRLTRRSEERRGRYARLSLANLMAFSEEALPNVLRWFRTRIVRAGVPVIFKATPQFPVRGTPLFAARAQGAADYYLIGDRSRTTD